MKIYSRILCVLVMLLVGGVWESSAQEEQSYWAATNAGASYDNPYAACEASWKSYSANDGLEMTKFNPVGNSYSPALYACSAKVPEGGGYWGTAGTAILRCPGLLRGTYGLQSCAQKREPVSTPSCFDPEKPGDSSDNPVHIPSGAKIERYVDFSTADGLMRQTRTHTSNGLGGSLLGAGWMLSTHTNLREFEDKALIQTGDGVVLVLTPDEARIEWKSYKAYGYRLLREESGGWQLAYPDGRVDLFDDEYRIIRTTFRSGYQYFHTWEDDLLVSVSDTFGREIRYEYDEYRHVSAAIDPAGRRYEYRYKHRYGDVLTGSRVYSFANSVLTEVSYPDASTVKYQHGELVNWHKITGIVDERNIKTKSVEYVLDRVYASEGVDGRKRVETPFRNTNKYVEYDDKYFLINPLGHLTEWKFKRTNSHLRPAGFAVSAAASVEESSTSISYTDGRMTSRNDAEGYVTEWDRDDLNRPTRITYLKGTSSQHDVAIEWHPTLYQPTLIEDADLRIEFVLDDYANVVQRTEFDKITGEQRQSNFTYEIGGLLSLKDGPLPGMSDSYAYSYNADGYLASSTDPVGNVTQFSGHDGLGNPQQITRPNGSMTSLTYDLRSRVMSIVENGQRTTQFERDAAGNITKVTLPTGGSMTYTYEGNGWVMSVSSSAGEVMSFTHDNMGNVTSRTLSGSRPGSSASFEYDVLGRLMKSISADAGVTEYTYDRLDRIVGMKDPTGHEWLYSLDGLSRLLKVTDPEGDETASAFDPDGDETAFTDGRDLTTSYTYNGFGEVLSETSPDRGTTLYTYDEASRLTQKTDAKGNVTSYTYDVSGRLLNRSHVGQIDRSYSYSYDASGDRGMMTGAVDPSGATSMDYNVFRELVSLERTLGAHDYRVETSYTDIGQPFIVTYPSGRSIRYAYDQLGRVKNIKSRIPGQSWVNVVTGVGYAPMGPIIGYTSFNGLRNVRALDSSYRLRAMRVQDGASKLLHKTLKRDAAGRIIRINDQLDSGNSARYAYTPDGRLRLADGPWGERRWWYDGVGNRKRQLTVDETGTKIERSVIPATSNQIRVMRDENGTELRRFGHDANGNMLWDQKSDGRQRYIYDADNRLHRVKKDDAVLAVYGYDGFNRRISRRLADGSRVHFIFGYDGRPLAEHDGQTGAVVREFVWLGDMLVTTIEDGQMYAVHGGHLGQPLMATDATQSIVWQAEFTPFGATLPIIDGGDPGLRFPGQWADAETGLLQNWHRDYDPSIGRYIEADPLGLDAGQSLYGYVGQDPMGAIDPKGLRCYGMGCYEPYKSVRDNTDDGKLFGAALIAMGGATAVPILAPLAIPTALGGGGSSAAGGFLFGYGFSAYGEANSGDMNFGQVVKDACFSALLGKIGGSSKQMAKDAIPVNASNAGAGRMALSGTGAAIGGGLAGAAYGAGVDQNSDAVGDRILEGMASGAMPRP